ncbi:MAG: chemotaxis response regulator protein-glutamate methylesterase [Candidatus Omnitrophota bacterium]|nr:chemotaxis response regulator protein-glutamate methylesterase [Candidatus Omnitrophota bacterium]
MADKIRVLVADDSALMRKKISDILSSDPDIEVVGVVRNGREALAAVYSLKPDVVTLDVEMPVLNGIDTLGYIMSEVPTPCVMISAFTTEGAKETIRSLEFGAVDFVTKPSGVISPDIGKVGKEIITKVKIAAKISVKKLRLIWAKKAEEKESVLKKPVAMSKVFAIASSTGGVQALSVLLPALRGDLEAGILIVQHMPKGFTKSLAERLNWQSKINVVEAEDNMPIKPAQVIIAKGGLHMEVIGKEDSPSIALNNKPIRMGLKPNANILMQSVAKVFKQNSVGVILTGMGSDGTLGAQAIKSCGGTVLAEHESSCVIYGMPRSVVESGFADRIVPLHEMAREMEELVL